MPRKTAIVTRRRRRQPGSASGTGAHGPMRNAKYALGQVVRHRVYAFRGVVFDIDPVFSNSEEWWLAIPAEIRPVKDQPYYHLLAENSETEYIAYVSEQNLLPDESGEPLRHPQIGDYFEEDEEGRYRAVFIQRN
jgi:heat shock protein HspQ